MRSAASRRPTSSSSSSTRDAERRAGHAVDAALEHEVLAPGRLPVDAGVLRDVADRAAHAVRVAHDVLARDDRASGVGLRQRRERAHRRRLAGAVRAEQPEHLAVAHGERDAVERLHVLVALAQVFGDDRVHAAETTRASGLDFADADAGPDADDRRRSRRRETTSSRTSSRPRAPGRSRRRSCRIRRRA